MAHKYVAHVVMGKIRSSLTDWCLYFMFSAFMLKPNLALEVGNNECYGGMGRALISTVKNSENCWSVPYRSWLLVSRDLSAQGRIDATRKCVLRMTGGGGSGTAIYGNIPDRADPKLRRLNLKLWDAARRGEADKLEALVKGGAQLNAGYETEEGTRNTALHFAVIGGHTRAVEELVRLGADIMASDECENVALHIAAAQGNLEMVKLLTTLGCDVRSINMHVKVARLTAMDHGKTAVAKWLDEQEDMCREVEDVQPIEWIESSTVEESDYGTDAPLGGIKLFKSVRKLIKDEMRDEGEEEYFPDLGAIIEEGKKQFYPEHPEIFE